MTDRIRILKDLRDRVATATGPDWHLTIAIEAALHDGLEVIPAIGSDSSFVRNPKTMRGYRPPNYTASLDAAATLEGIAPYVDVLARPDSVRVEWIGMKTAVVVAIAKTEPLARCLARINYEIALAEATEKAAGIA